MAVTFTLRFVVFLLIIVGLKYLLALRQIRHVSRHAERAPAQFADRITLDAHRRAAADTVAKQRLGLVQTAVSAAVLVALTLLGGLRWIADTLQPIACNGLLFQVAVVALAVALISLLEMPFESFRQFRVEQSFGSNRMTSALFLTDTRKSLLLAAALGLPITATVLWPIQSAGRIGNSNPITGAPVAYARMVLGQRWEPAGLARHDLLAQAPCGSATRPASALPTPRCAPAPALALS